MPDAILWSSREKSSVIVSGCRVGDSVTDDYISSAAHEAALDVAHQAHNKVNVLGNDKDFVVVANISALADIQKGQQCCARSASRVRHGDETLHVGHDLGIECNLCHAAKNWPAWSFPNSHIMYSDPRKS